MTSRPAVYAICRPFLSQRTRQVMCMDCTLDMLLKHFPKQIINEGMGGMQRPVEMMDLLEECIKKRFENEEFFRWRNP